ncbi:MBL fold metallo-hydrolase [Nocardiopsis sp. FIRDI 009]|uniref:MBL fold metallo-hydrolase n=1 Tax=Nocardiopsis sp. FIRDI 009 TaxID=714197 RepID=UPI000E27F6A0|nr:MBL fold metallo-hydrolase [Nocardiopsis sp. FIRDI 009]
MLILGFPAGVFGTNTYVLAERPGAGCVIIDPGQRSLEGLGELVARHRLEPEAVLLTHGHMDHTWDAVPVSERYDVPVYVHADDRFMVGAPARGLPRDFPAHLLEGHPNTDPTDLREIRRDRTTVRAAGLDIEALHTGGHTPGSMILHVRGEGSALFTGDALLTGALGRTDGPGGDEGRLRTALAEHCRALPDTTAIHPGHGESTTLRAERRLHPFLRPDPVSSHVS